MIWTNDNRTLVMSQDGPSRLHAATLAAALQDLTGDRPSIRSLHGSLVSVHFHADLSASKRSAVKATVAAHDGSAAEAIDETARQKIKAAAAARDSIIKAMRTKRMEGKQLTTAERKAVLDIVIDRALGLS